MMMEKPVWMNDYMMMEAALDERLYDDGKAGLDETTYMMMNDGAARINARRAEVAGKPMKLFEESRPHK